MICLMFDFFTKNCSIKNMLGYNQHFCLHWSPFLVFYKEISLFKSEVSLESSLDIKIFVSFELLVSNMLLNSYIGIMEFENFISGTSLIFSREDLKVVKTH